MTGWANDQGFASFLEHDLRPLRSIFSHRCQFGKFAYLVNHALFVFDGTEFTGACYESSHYLPSLIASHAGCSINHYGFVVPHQRNSAKAGHQRLLATTSKQRCLKALSRAVRCLDGGLEAFCHPLGGAAIFCCQRVGQGLLNDPFVPSQPRHIAGEQIVLDEAPIFVLIGFQDGIIRAGGQRESSQRFSSLSIDGDFLFHHFFWDA